MQDEDTLNSDEQEISIDEEMDKVFDETHAKDAERETKAEEPDTEAAETKPGRERDEKGKFKAKTETPEPESVPDTPETPEQAADLILETRDNGWARFGVFEIADEQLELEMATRTGLIELFKEKAKETLRLVPVIAGG